RDEQAARALLLRQPAAPGGARGRGQRVVPAGVEDDEVDPVAGRLQVLDRQAELRALAPHVLLGLDLLIHRNEVVAALALHGVTGVVDDPDRVLARARQARTMFGELRLDLFEGA